MRRLVAGVVLAVLAVPAAAAALPQDPPIEPLSPAEGATVPPAPNGITVSFRCPPYQRDAGSTGGPADYRVRFSNRPVVDDRGELDAVKPLVTVTAGPDGTCSATSDPALALGEGGRLYWQAIRHCPGCVFTSGSSWELGPVRSFVVGVAADASLTVPRRVYAGYHGVFAVRATADITGAEVRLERRVGSSWRRAGSETASGRTAELLAKLPAGRQRIRVTIGSGEAQTVLATRTLTVRRATSWSTSRRDDGAYRASADRTLKLTIADRGRRLRNLTAPISLACPTPDAAANRVATVVKLASAPIAPDGSVVREQRFTGESGGTGTVRLVGRLRNGRLTATLDASLPGCFGTAKLVAAKR